jgi:superfamily I DNA/RNA helicase
MTYEAFEGPAGCGKTYRLLETLRELLSDNVLRDGQRVLAITYMHGSRRKLATSLRVIPGLAGRYECSTLDSVALRWVRRWRDLLVKLGQPLPAERDFDQTCSAAATLIRQPHVCAWVAASFPLIMVDEAQDLTAERLEIVRALGQRTHVLIAGDEFQCLQDKLRPNPFEQWCDRDLRVTRLDVVKRTDEASLLGAAAALRAGLAPKAGSVLKIEETPSAALAGAYIVNAVCWYSKGGRVAILAPSLSAFVCDAITWAQENESKGNGPIKVAWERSEADECGEVLPKLHMSETAAIEVVHDAIDALKAPRVAHYVHAWVERQRNALGRLELHRSEIEAAVVRAIGNRRRFGRASEGRVTAMSIHTAKNREFDGVIILWPYQVAGSDDQKRRLLYNGITRARKWVRILVQRKTMLAAAPFK